MSGFSLQFLYRNYRSTQLMNGPPRPKVTAETSKVSEESLGCRRLWGRSFKTLRLFPDDSSDPPTSAEQPPFQSLAGDV